MDYDKLINDVLQQQKEQLRRIRTNRERKSEQFSRREEVYEDLVTKMSNDDLLFPKGNILRSNSSERRVLTIQEMPDNLITEDNERKIDRASIESANKVSNFTFSRENFNKSVNSDKSDAVTALTNENKELIRTLEALLIENKKLEHNFTQIEREFDVYQSNSELKERELISIIKEREEEIKHFREQFHQIKQNGGKNSEIKLLRHKISNYESLLEETYKESTEEVKNLDNEITYLKHQLGIQDNFSKAAINFVNELKMIINSQYNEDDQVFSNYISKTNFPLSAEFINIDDFLKQLTNISSFLKSAISIKAEVEAKYKKLLNIHQLDVMNNSIDLQKLNLETIKKLNMKIAYLSAENTSLQNDLTNLRITKLKDKEERKVEYEKVIIDSNRDRDNDEVKSNTDKNNNKSEITVNLGINPSKPKDGIGKETKSQDSLKKTSSNFSTKGVLKESVSHKRQLSKKSSKKSLDIVKNK